MAGLLETRFSIEAQGSTIRREIMAGITTFLAMAYITVVNPTILSEAGMDFGAVFVATCLAAAIGTAIMGLYANYPVAQAPGMGQNAFFTYGIVLGMGYAWQTALGGYLSRASSSSCSPCCRCASGSSTPFPAP